MVWVWPKNDITTRLVINFLLLDANTATQLGGMDVVNHIIKRAESDETIYKSMKNLLFSSENLSSDSDDDK